MLPQLGGRGIDAGLGLKSTARREKDIIFVRELARRGIVTRERLLVLLNDTPVDEEVRQRIQGDIEADF